MQILQNFISDTNSDGALIMSNMGVLESAVNVDYQESVAAMSAAIISMSEKFLDDLEKGNMKQIYLKTNEGLVVFTKTNNNVVVVFNKNASNLGMFLHKIDQLAIEINKN